MAYLVVYQAADGASGYEPCDDLQSAILAAERMRNVDQVDAPRIFRTEEVHFDFRPYYRIEVTDDVPSPVAADEIVPPLAPVFDMPPPATSLSADEVVGWPDDGVDEQSGVSEPEPIAELDETPHDADSSDEAAAVTDEAPDVVEDVDQVTDSVISPRRGLFGR